MEDIKVVHRKFVAIMVQYILFIVFEVAVVAGSWIYIEYVNVQVAIYAFLILLLIFVTSIFKARFETVINTSYIVKIRYNQAPPLDTKLVNAKTDLTNNLFNSDYEEYHNDNDFFLFYKVQKDHIKKMFEGYILEIVVYLYPHNDKFYLDSVDEQVQKLYIELHNKKIDVDKLLITQIRVIDEVDANTKQQIKENVFLKTKRELISTINVGIDLDSSKAVMLYSETYTPSLYYTYHINQIKKMI